MAQPRRTKLRHVVRRITRPLLWPVQALALVLFWGGCALLPPERAAALGAGLLRRLGPRLGWHRRLLDNLAIALPAAADAEIEAIASEVWASFGATMAEYPHLGAIGNRRWREHVEVVMSPAVARGQAAGRAIVFVTGHFGNWEISAAMAKAFGIPATAVYTPQANPFTDWLLQRCRRALGCGFATSDAGMRQLLGELRAGRSIGSLIDVRVPHGAPLTFFGHRAETTLVPARLALKFGAMLVPVRVERLGPARFRVHVHDPIEADPAVGTGQEAARQMMQRVNHVLESWVRARPGDWRCLHNRWAKDVRLAALRARAARRASPPAAPGTPAAA